MLVFSNVRAALEESIGKTETFVITEVMPFERQSPCTYTAPEVNTGVVSSHNMIELYVGELFETTLPVDLFTDEVRLSQVFHFITSSHLLITNDAAQHLQSIPLKQ